MDYRELSKDEVHKIQEIDATNFIERAWRLVDGQYRLVEINWTDYELPNGLGWHKERLTSVLKAGGKAFGCFDGKLLVGYAVVTNEIFGTISRYVLLDQLFVSKSLRGKGIGKTLFAMCAEEAVTFGADKLFLCASSAEDTIAFYHKIGCVKAVERNQKLYEEDPRDIQMEYVV